MDEIREVGFAVRILSCRIRHYIEARMEGVESPTHMQGRVIGYLTRHEGQDVFQRDLESEFQIRRSTATAMLQVMEREGLITREPVARDARLKKLVLTQKARAQCERFGRRIQEMEAQVTRGVPQAELDQFFATMRKFMDNLETDGGTTDD